MNETWWLIEMGGPAYLATRHLGGYDFHWTTDVHSALRFYSRDQANLTMMAIRQLRGDLFPPCLPVSPYAVEHSWVPDHGIRRTFEPEMVVEVEGGDDREVHVFEFEQDGDLFLEHLPSGRKTNSICIGGLVTHHAARTVPTTL